MGVQVGAGVGVVPDAVRRDQALGEQAGRRIDPAAPALQDASRPHLGLRPQHAGGLRRTDRVAIREQLLLPPDQLGPGGAGPEPGMGAGGHGHPAKVLGTDAPPAKLRHFRIVTC